VKPGDSTGTRFFGKEGRAGCIPAASLRAVESTAEVAKEAMDAAHKHGNVIVSYDLNYRDSLWKSIGGKARAQEVNRELVKKVDVAAGQRRRLFRDAGLGD
jgi:2-dehydro-3-deoxygluconokinase